MFKGIVFGFLLPVSLFSIPIDVSVKENEVTVPVSGGHSEPISFDLYQFSENTLYVFRFDDNVKIRNCLDSQITLGDNNTLLIEHESSLRDATLTVLADMTTDASTVTIHKVAVPTDAYPRLDDSIWHSFV